MFTSSGIYVYKVPLGVTKLTISASGASGGRSSAACRLLGSSTLQQAPGGVGGTIAGDFDVTSGQVLTVVVGGAGATPSACVSGAGGYNGGGSGGKLGGGGGGGMSLVKTANLK